MPGKNQKRQTTSINTTTLTPNMANAESTPIVPALPAAPLPMAQAIPPYAGWGLWSGIQSYPSLPVLPYGQTTAMPFPVLPSLTTVLPMYTPSSTMGLWSAFPSYPTYSTPHHLHMLASAQAAATLITNGPSIVSPIAPSSTAVTHPSVPPVTSSTSSTTTSTSSTRNTLSSSSERSIPTVSSSSTAASSSNRDKDDKKISELIEIQAHFTLHTRRVNGVDEPVLLRINDHISLAMYCISGDTKKLYINYKDFFTSQTNREIRRILKILKDILIKAGFTDTYNTIIKNWKTAPFLATRPLPLELNKRTQLLSKIPRYEECPDHYMDNYNYLSLTDLLRIESIINTELDRLSGEPYKNGEKAILPLFTLLIKSYQDQFLPPSSNIVPAPMPEGHEAAVALLSLSGRAAPLSTVERTSAEASRKRPVRQEDPTESSESTKARKTTKANPSTFSPTLYTLKKGKMEGSHSLEIIDNVGTIKARDKSNRNKELYVCIDENFTRTRKHELRNRLNGITNVDRDHSPLVKIDKKYYFPLNFLFKRKLIIYENCSTSTFKEELNLLIDAYGAFLSSFVAKSSQAPLVAQSVVPNSVRAAVVLQEAPPAATNTSISAAVNSIGLFRTAATSSSSSSSSSLAPKGIV